MNMRARVDLQQFRPAVAALFPQAALKKTKAIFGLGLKKASISLCARDLRNAQLRSNGVGHG
jgi:hypothetical protein